MHAYTAQATHTIYWGLCTFLDLCLNTLLPSSVLFRVHIPAHVLPRSGHMTDGAYCPDWLDVTGPNHWLF